MLIEKRKEINELIKQLEDSIINDNGVLFIKDIRCPSLVLWSKYQRYLNGILSLFDPKERQEYKKLEAVITDLRLDKFYFSASDPCEQSEKDLKNYIKLAKETISRND